MSKKKDFIVFIGWIRALAPLLVLYAHMVGQYLEGSKLYWSPNDFIQRFIIHPLGIIQDFGFLGVVLFFLISGFIVTFTAQRETRFTFFIKRFMRIYPPIIVAIIFFIVLYYVVVRFYGITIIEQEKLSLKSILMSMTLFNYVLVQQNPLIGVAWTLIIEVLFYIMMFLILPIVGKNPKLTIISLLSLTFCVVFFSRSVNPNFFLLAVSISYIPIIILGQILYYWWSKQIGLVNAVSFFIVAYLEFIWGVKKLNPQFYSISNSYSLSLFYGILIFAALMMNNRILSMPPIIKFFENISYSLYLYHGLVGLTFLTLTQMLIPYSYALFFAIVLTFLVSYASYLFVEYPSQKLARMIVKHRG